MVMCLVINKALDHSQHNLNWRLWPHVTAGHVTRMIKAHQTITNNPVYLCLWPKAPWMRVVGLPSLPPRYALTRFKKVSYLVDVDWCWCWLTDNQGGWNCFYERPLFRAQVKHTFWLKRVFIKILSTLISTQQIGHAKRAKQELKYHCFI